MTPPTAAEFDPESYTRQLTQSWSEVAPHYDKISIQHFSPIMAAFLEFAGLRVGQRVLDVACGSGAASLAAAKAVGPTGQVTGVDLAGGMLELARARAAELGLKTCEFSGMNAERLRFPESCFDAVLCSLGLMLFAKPDEALWEMSRVVRPGGAVSCLVQGRGEKMQFTSIVNRLMAEHAPQLKIPGAPTLFAFGVEGALRSFYEKAGFEQFKEERREGVFFFPSAESYWETLTAGGGRTRAMLETIAPATRETIKTESLRQAEAFRKDGRLEIPYEFVLARGIRALE